MDTIKLCWAYFRNLLGTLLLLAPIFLAAWVFQMALDIHGGLGLAFAGAFAVLLLFRGYWRMWAIFFPAVFRMARPMLVDLLRMAVRRN